MNDCDLQDQDQTTESALEEGKVFDYITGEAVKDTDKERVRQRIARAIIHEYGIPAEDMEPDFRVKVGGRNKKIDIAIFRPGAAHAPENLYRMVVVEKEPKLGAKSAYRMRDPEEARKEFDLLEAVMAEIESCHYGVVSRNRRKFRGQQVAGNDPFKGWSSTSSTDLALRTKAPRQGCRETSVFRCE